ncbi:GlsB/YeaQ/YmgE family stress response membrane protein [Bosea sp. (in: a-proteobacteria)]|jgi:uncharacterized membrane protein YeaQ/YmgE (transglycosylase-associated protein family)|uniref:GlsB/YeaQ/YmgE family stress response membrane protein n=1 Tax=Bosea sp. (in: a-proteobacteria) TaxID=1871050 RepID=UPI003F728CC8
MDNSIYAALGTPGYGFFMTLLIGMLAGWIAERITSSDHGIFTNMLVGVAGSFIGSRLAELLEIPIFGFLRTLIAAIAGAVVVIVIWNAMRKPRV